MVGPGPTGPGPLHLTVWHREGLEIHMYEYQAQHRSKADQAGRWFPLVIYGAGFLAITLLLSGLWA